MDLHMGYISNGLVEATRKVLTIVMPFEFDKCCVLPMRVLLATDNFQARIVGLFAPMIKQEWPNLYIDNLLHPKGKDFDAHLWILDEIFEKLELAGM